MNTTTVFIVKHNEWKGGGDQREICIAPLSFVCNSGSGIIMV